MIRLFLLFWVTLFPLYAQQTAKCDRCTIGKEFMRCSYYVEKKGDLSKQKSCLLYADSLFTGESPGRASWFYIVGGDFDKAIEAANIALKRGSIFALEHLGEAYILKGEQNKAQKYFYELKKSDFRNDPIITKHFETLQKLYPEKFKLKSL